MGSQGEYSDRSVWTIGVTAKESRAKELVLELVEADKLKNSIADAKAKMRSAFVAEWEKVNPEPIPPDIQRPVFDQSRHKDKQYVAEHSVRKNAWLNANSEFNRGPRSQWLQAQREAADIYVESNFTMDLCEPPQWTDNQYWYEEVEELV